jgi:hypothetical protein
MPQAGSLAYSAAASAVFSGLAKSDQKNPFHHLIERSFLRYEAGHHPIDGGAPLCHFGLLM